MGLNQIYLYLFLSKSEVYHNFPTALVVVQHSNLLLAMPLARMMTRRLPSLLGYYYPLSSSLLLSTITTGWMLMNKCAGKGVTRFPSADKIKRSMKVIQWWCEEISGIHSPRDDLEENILILHLEILDRYMSNHPHYGVYHYSMDDILILKISRVSCQQ